MADDNGSPQVDVVADTICVYNDVNYSPGSISCQKGLLYRCQDDGTWLNIGGPCDPSADPQ